MILVPSDLARVRADHPGKKVVMTSGTYDLLHVGHLRYLEAAKAHGDVLVVCLSGDARVQARKGPTRPIIPEADRAQLLDALRLVDYVFIDAATPGQADAEASYQQIITALHPDVYVTDGEDVRFAPLLDKQQQIVLDRSDVSESTTAIIERIERVQ